MFGNIRIIAQLVVLVLLLGAAFYGGVQFQKSSAERAREKRIEANKTALETSQTEIKFGFDQSDRTIDAARKAFDDASSFPISDRPECGLSAGELRSLDQLR